jgi:hypothetical protein
VDADSGTRRENLSAALAMAWEDRLLNTLRTVQPRLTEAAAGVVVADRM